MSKQTYQSVKNKASVNCLSYRFLINLKDIAQISLYDGVCNKLVISLILVSCIYSYHELICRGVSLSKSRIYYGRTEFGDIVIQVNHVNNYLRATLWIESVSKFQ